MDNNQQIVPKNRRVSLIIPSIILLDPRLSLNEKLMLGLDYCFNEKLGYNSMFNKEIGALIGLHPNIVSKGRRRLLKIGYLIKEKRNYYLRDNSIFVDKRDYRSLIVPFWIYSNVHLSTGAKILWAEYNSFNNNGKSYFATREFTAGKIGCSVESVSNWTRELIKHNLLKSYELKSGYCTKQKEVLTCRFSKEGEIIV